MECITKNCIFFLNEKDIEMFVKKSLIDIDKIAGKYLEYINKNVKN